MGDSAPGPPTQTQVTQSNLPPWLQDADVQVVNTALDLAQKPYVPYGGQQVANLSPLTTQAANQIQAQQGSWQPSVGGAASTFANMAASNPVNQVTPTSANIPTLNGYQAGPNGENVATNMSQYLNPYLSSVVNPTAKLIEQGAGQQQASDLRKAGLQGAYGGSGSNELQALSTQALGTALGQQVGQLESQGFNTALGASQADRAAQLQAAQQQGQLNLGANSQALGYNQLNSANQISGLQIQDAAAQNMTQNALAAQQAGYADTAQLQGAGNLAQTNQQQVLNANYANFINQQQFPYNQLDFAKNVLYGTPSGYSTSYSQAAPNSLGQTLGTGLVASQVGKNVANSFNGSARGGRVRGALPRTRRT